MAISAYICADWSKERKKRTAFLADPLMRHIRKLPNEPTLTFSGMLDVATTFAANGSVILGFDVPIGVPCSFLYGQHNTFGAITFRELLESHGASAAFFQQTLTPIEWSPKKPFFAVPKGQGALSAFTEAAQRFGVDLYRKIEKLTGGKSLFITHGIPGSVGSSVCALWPEIAEAIHRHQRFSMWPFDGTIEELTSAAGVVVGEIYPRAAYATSLLDGSPLQRPQISVAKTSASVRKAAVAQLRNSQWMLEHSVAIENIEEAEQSEDDFDALMTAAALLRCDLEGVPLHGVDSNPEIEGGMLATGSVNLHLQTKQFRTNTDVVCNPSNLDDAKPSVEFRCPIQNCTHVFKGSRGGWDSHVASLARHPSWHPEIVNGEERKNLFRNEFPDFLRGA